MSASIVEVPIITGNNLKHIPDSNNNGYYGRYSSSISELVETGEKLLKQKYLNSIKNKNELQENEDTNKFIPSITNLLKEQSKKQNTQQNYVQNIISTGNIYQPLEAKETPKLYDINGIAIGEQPKKLELYNPKIITDKNEISTDQMINEINQYNPTKNKIDEMIQAKTGPTYNSKKVIEHNLGLEVLKCRLSSVYFIENYVSVPVTGGRVSMKESEQWNSTDKYKIIINLFQQYDLVLYMSSRQSGKTTTSAMYLLWCMIFFPKIQISYLTLDKARAIDMISRMKEMMDSLPKWMQVKPKSKAERLSYYELANGSKISASFVSGSNDPDRVGRGLTAPIIFMDETAFIPHAKIVWGAVQPVYSAAKIFAKKNGYPYGVIFTSTPNGAGDNFFYNIYQNSIKFDDIYNYETKSMYPDYKKQFDLADKNDFISVVLHWSEFRTQEWYQQQRKELNFDIKKINQELDLAFLGSATCIFSDEVIARLYAKKRIDRIKLNFGHEFDLFKEIDPKKKYILGVDTAMSTGSTSDYSAIVLTEAETGDPIGEWHGRFSVVKRFAQLVKVLIQSLKVWYGLNSRSLIVSIERNSIGKEVVEELVYDESDFDYEEYLFSELVGGEKVLGIFTSNSGKMGQGKRDQMFQLLVNHVNERPNTIHGKLIIDECRNLEQKTNGRIEASKNQHDDVVMAWNFCLYTRKVLIESGQLFIPGVSRNNRSSMESSVINSILSTGNLINNNKPTSNVITVNNISKIDKMAGITKVQLKEREETRKEISSAMSNVSQIMKNVFIKKSEEDNEEDEKESYTFDNYFIM